MKLFEALLKSAKFLKEHQIETPELDSRILFSFASIMSQEQILLNRDLDIKKDTLEKFQALLERRAKNEPVAKIINLKSFWKNDFFVSSDCLDPRPDSEVIISSAIDILKNKNENYRFLDICTGSGCLALSLLLEFPNANAVASDISFSALKIAQKNALNMDISHRCHFVKQNWADSINYKFDLIVCNPPYIPTGDINFLQAEVRLYDPMLALDGGEDGLIAYNYLSKEIRNFLKPNGYAIIEFGDKQDHLVEQIFIQQGYVISNILSDLAGIKRAIVLSI